MKRWKAAVGALVVSAALVGGTSTGWSPICAAIEPGSVLWYVFFCYVDTPPNPPEG